VVQSALQRKPRDEEVPVLKAADDSDQHGADYHERPDSEEHSRNDGQPVYLCAADGCRRVGFIDQHLSDS
jgi:hypothetical protein